MLNKPTIEERLRKQRARAKRRGLMPMGLLRDLDDVSVIADDQDIAGEIVGRRNQDDPR